MLIKKSEIIKKEEIVTLHELKNQLIISYENDQITKLIFRGIPSELNVFPSEAWTIHTCKEYPLDDFFKLMKFLILLLNI